MTTLKPGRVAKALDIDPKTVTNWIDDPHFKEFFSPEARGEGVMQRVINDEDFKILNSIRTMKTSGNSDHRAIAENLRSGWREGKLPMSAATVDLGRSALHETAKTAITAAERDKALQQIRENQEEIRRLYQRIIELERENGELTGKMSSIEERVRAESKAELAELRTKLDLLLQGWKPPQS